jgi:Zn finger protein HypA/HybF involved in hydrogenase expression
MQRVPIFKKVERAQVIILDGKELDLKKCTKCGTEFYGEEKQTKCEACRKRRKK